MTSSRGMICQVHHQVHQSQEICRTVIVEFLVQFLQGQYGTVCHQECVDGMRVKKLYIFVLQLLRAIIVVSRDEGNNCCVYQGLQQGPSLYSSLVSLLFPLLTSSTHCFKAVERSHINSVEIQSISESFGCLLCATVCCTCGMQWVNACHRDLPNGL